jgi:hypothetical protein
MYATAKNIRIKEIIKNRLEYWSPKEGFKKIVYIIPETKERPNNNTVHTIITMTFSFVISFRICII